MKPRYYLLVMWFALLLAVEWREAWQAYERWEDSRDHRPPLNLLFLGNSRTFANDMPTMIRRIADSANSPQKYEITMHAPGGVRLEDHWESAEVQELLGKSWDDVVLQGRSNEQLYGELEENFQTYGKWLVDKIKEGGATPVLFVMWRYDDPDGLYKVMPKLKDTLHGLIQQSYATLAQRTGAKMVNVGYAWEKVRKAAPNIKLYSDTNHPSIAGSYLAALMFYRFFSHDDLSHVTYAPPGLTPMDVDVLKTAAMGR